MSETFGFTVAVVGNDVMEARWGEIEAALRLAFAEAAYSDQGYDIDNPIGYTRAGMDGRLGPHIGHVLALNNNDRVIGGLFCVRTGREGEETSCDIGWVFIMPDVPGRKRRSLMDALMQQAFDTLRAAGFTHIISNMGTRAGALVLGRYYGFVFTPTDDKPNRWVKDLSS